MKLLKRIGNCIRRILPSFSISDPEETEIVILLSRQSRIDMLELMQLSECRTEKDFFNNMFATYDSLQNHLHEGGKIILRDKDGGEEEFNL